MYSSYIPCIEDFKARVSPGIQSYLVGGAGIRLSVNDTGQGELT